MMFYIAKRQRKDSGGNYCTFIFRDQHGKRHERTAGPRKKNAVALRDFIVPQIIAGTWGVKPPQNLNAAE